MVVVSGTAEKGGGATAAILVPRAEDRTAAVFIALRLEQGVNSGESHAQVPPLLVAGTGSIIPQQYSIWVQREFTAAF